MADEVLRKKKLVHAGHRVSATCMVTKVDELLGEAAWRAEGLSDEVMPGGNVERHPMSDEEFFGLLTEEATIAEEIEYRSKSIASAATVPVHQVKLP